MNIKKITKNILLSLGIFLLAVVLSILFQKLEIGEHITIIFMFAVFLISLLTDGYAYGIISAIGGMLAVNYAFTYPYFALDFNIPVNLISAIIMTAVSILTGMLTTKIKNYEAEKAKSEEQQDVMLKNIEEDSEWLVRMVENLLSITRINNEKIKIEKTSVILDELIDSVMTKFLNRHPEQKVTIDIPNEIVVVSVDPILIEQVLMNLLENAVFHAENMTHIILRVFASERKVIFEIADDGCGIREDMLKDIFGGTYGTQNNSADGKKRNAGIGLSVCATIIKAHDGEISAENRKDGGALFRFTLGKEDSAYDE